MVVAFKTYWGILCFCFLSVIIAGCSFQSDRPAPVASVNIPVKTAYNKGSLKSDSYRVKKGDTLYSIAWASNNDFIKLANKNNLKKPYTIYPGQKLNLNLTRSVTNSQQSKSTSKTSPKVVSKVGKSLNKQVDKKGVVAGEVKAAPSKKSLDPAHNSEYSVTSNQQSVNQVVHRQTDILPKKVSRWQWPRKGKLIGTFSAKEQGNKGIKIAGNRGDIIKSAADGRVVYAGSALRGYGNLVIIKHSDDYLSAYAHADKILVKEKQFVAVGQTLAKMGSTGTDRVMLHFEIRYHGKSVNPLKYLPKQ
ncbi:peptidoglycan DD-metalloendopeptidase family protein [uncultured Shewanella sp.]|uniref:peptidoglycan DD-metalloendopeptidase family protein n=1 Tax=uncultured Shewanella sp. TaxID=173975 RepID=UPI00260E2F57|nr:peptidoglycan DD-metalloendopeptidase family protein [uncultured Shewanella sp.]